jgi:hypothetical protein
MLPEPTAVSQTPFTNASPAPSPTSSQHGNDHRCDEPVFDILPREDVEDRHLNDASSGLPSAGVHGIDEPLLRRLSSAADNDAVLASSPSSTRYGFHSDSSHEDVFQSSPAQYQSKVYALQANPRQTLSDLPNGTLASMKPRNTRFRY